MTTFEIGNGLLARLDAVEKVADVPLELIALAARAVLGGRGPVLGRARVGGALRPADGIAGAGGLRNPIGRRKLAVRSHGVAAPRNAETAFGPIELEGRTGKPAAARLAMRPDRREARILDQDVL